MKRQWGDVEITVYAKRLRDVGSPTPASPPSRAPTTCRRSRTQARRPVTPAGTGAASGSTAARTSRRRPVTRRTTQPRSVTSSTGTCHARGGSATSSSCTTSAKRPAGAVGRLHKRRERRHVDESELIHRLGRRLRSGPLPRQHRSNGPADERHLQGRLGVRPTQRVRLLPSGRSQENGMHYKWASVREIPRRAESHVMVIEPPGVALREESLGAGAAGRPGRRWCRGHSRCDASTGV